MNGFFVCSVDGLQEDGARCGVLRHYQQNVDRARLSALGYPGTTPARLHRPGTLPGRHPRGRQQLLPQPERRPRRALVLHHRPRHPLPELQHSRMQRFDHFRPSLSFIVRAGESGAALWGRRRRCCCDVTVIVTMHSSNWTTAWYSSPVSFHFTLE